MSTSITKLADKLETAQNRIKKVKEEGQAIAVRTMHGVTTIAGGAMVGAIRGYWGDANGDVKLFHSQVDADLAIGVLALGAGITGIAGKASDEAVAFGSGALAVVTARALEHGIKSHAHK